MVYLAKNPVGTMVGMVDTVGHRCYNMSGASYRRFWWRASSHCVSLQPKTGKYCNDHFFIPLCDCVPVGVCSVSPKPVAKIAAKQNLVLIFGINLEQFQP